MKPSAPKISVILSVYNGAKFLESSLRSVLGQTFEDFEFLVIDDCSTDDSVSLLERVHDERYKFWLNRRNAGLFDNLNRLIKRSRAPLIKLWSQDDVMLVDCLEKGMSYFRQNPEIGCFWCANDTIDRNGRVIAASKFDATPAILDPDTANRYALDHGCLSSNISNLFIPRPSFDDVGSFDVDFIAADFEFMVRVQEKRNIGRLPDTLVQIRQHPGQWSLAGDSLPRFVEDDIKIYRRLRTRLLDSKTLEPERIDKVLHEKFGQNHFHAAVRCAAAGRWRVAVRILRQISGFVSLSAVARTWFRGLYPRLRNRIGQ